MRTENQPNLTSVEISQLTDHYLRHQSDLFETRIEEIGRSRRPSRTALREEGMIYAEMADETAGAVRDGVRLFEEAVFVDLASQCGIAPERVVDNTCLHDALALAVTRHHRECADRLLPRPRVGVLSRLFGQSSIVTIKKAPVRSSKGFVDPSVQTITAPSSVSDGSKAPDQRDGPANITSVRPSCVPEAMPAFDVQHYSSGSVVASWRSWTTAAATGFSGLSPVHLPKRDGPTLVSVRSAPESACGPAVSSKDPNVDTSDPDASRQKVAARRHAASVMLEPPCDGMFSTIWNDFVEAKIVTDRTYAPSRRPELGSTYNMVTWLVGGDFALMEATTGFLSELKRRYLTLPIDYKNMRIEHEDGKRWRTYTELMQHSSALGYSGATVKGKSWNKHKSNLSECVKWAKANRTSLADLVNGFSGLHIPVKKGNKAVKLERDMTPNNILVALFATPVWTGRRSYHLTKPGKLIIRDSLYWVPLLETGNGLRREEACQLRVRHIVRRFGIWIINLLAEDLRLKTDEASPRLAMIHREILDAGFIEALVTGRNPDELLFPELSNENAHRAYGVSFGKQISNYVSNVHFDLGFIYEELLEEIPPGTPDRDRLVAERMTALLVEYRDKFTNHGIRHWWKTTAVNARCHPAHVDDQLGHVGDTRGEGHRYQKELDCRVLKATVDQVPMPFNGAELKRLFEASLGDQKDTKR